LECIKLLKQMILEQTYLAKIIEWVIIDGSKTFHDDMEAKIKEICSDLPFKFVYIAWTPCMKIGALRNTANRAAKGDVLVCMDDDDYYPPERVEEAFSKLFSNQVFLIAGCSDTLLYDYILDKQYKFKPFHPYHSANNAIAFRREYLTNHSHDETVDTAEETSFTNMWTEPMLQLDPLRTVNVSSHTINTFNKRQLLVYSYTDRYDKAEEYPIRLIPNNYYTKMQKIFISDDMKICPYDIVYYCGSNSIQWDPEDETLGGSEHAVKYITQGWVKEGKSVVVYGCVPHKTYKGVEYMPWQLFPFNAHFKTLILWRLMGLSSIYFAKTSADLVLWDLHDNMKHAAKTMKYYMTFKKNLGRDVDKIMFKSTYHKTEFETIFPKLKEGKYLIIPNGLRVDEFKWMTSKYALQGFKREKLRFCYCSSYSRGLDTILRFVWPQIIHSNPDAELHLYYGMKYENEKVKMYLQQLIGMSVNVMNHDRRSLEEIVKEKSRATFQLYLTNTEAEIDCINIREGLICGCIPIISNAGVFKERDGMKIDVDYDGVKVNKDDEFDASGNLIPMDKKKNDHLVKEMSQAGMFIGKMLSTITDEQVEMMRTELAKSSMIMDWDTIALQWLKLDHYAINNAKEQVLGEITI